MVTRLISMLVLVMALAAVTIAGPATAAATNPAAPACVGKARAQQAAARLVSTRRPVAIVPGLRYDAATMIPSGISRTAPGFTPV